MGKVVAQTAQLPAGGGAYALERVTIGVFLNDQPRHRLSLGSDSAIAVPLARNEGWVLPAGADGLCLFEDALQLRTVALDRTMLRQAGLTLDTFQPIIGALDPLLLQLALTAGDPQQPTLYRETLERALAAHLSQTLAPVAPTMAQLDDARLRRAVEYIRDHLAEDLSLDAIAAEAGMGTDRFARAFKAALGKSPLQFVISERMAAAQVLLSTTTLPIVEIAYRVGYEDTSRFTAHFKARLGITPGRFRADA